MAGLLEDSVEAQGPAIRGLADASGMNLRRDQENREINAERVGGEIGLVGQLAGEAIGSIWHAGGEGSKLGKREGDTYGQIFTGKRPGTPNGSDMSPQGGDGSSLLGSMFKYLNGPKPSTTAGSGTQADYGYSDGTH